MLTYTVVTQPKRGKIVVGSEKADTFTQDQVTSGSLFYVHTDGEIGIENDNDKFELSVTDFFGRAKSVEINVIIIAVDNKAPSVSMQESFVVEEGSQVTIKTSHLYASDKDTLTDDILCIITSQAKEGFLENITPSVGSEVNFFGLIKNLLKFENNLSGLSKSEFNF